MSSFLHPFSVASQDEGDFINIVRAQGSTVWDDADNSYIDGIASLWLCQVGHSRREMIDAITTQANSLAGYNTFAPFTNSVAGRVADMIAERSPHPDGRVFLASSGSEAIDTALKLVRMVAQRRGDTQRQIIVKRTRGYHGTNFGGTTAQGLSPNRDGWGDLVPHFMEVDPDDLEAMATLFVEHGDHIAGVLTEPVQGAGGVWPAPEGYLEGLRRLCDDHGALLIFDEVITGFGRLGHWFGAQHYGVTPDVITFAKGVTSGYVPLSGVVISPDTAAVITEGDQMLRTGYTYSGHPLSCAAGIANIELLESDGLLERAVHVGQQLQAGLAALAADGTIESWRGVGAICAAELGRDPVPIRQKLLERGVILRPIATSLAICPPLVITDAEIDHIFDALVASLA